MDGAGRISLAPIKFDTPPVKLPPFIRDAVKVLWLESHERFLAPEIKLCGWSIQISVFSRTRRKGAITMKDPSKCSAGAAHPDAEDTHPTNEKGTKRSRGKRGADASRRSFLGKVCGATAAVTVGIPLEPLFEGKHGQTEASVIPYGSGGRTNASFQYRENTAQAEKIDVGVLPDSGDWLTFKDYSANWSKCLKHDALGIPDAASYQSLLHALKTGRFQDFENIIVGTPGGTGPNSFLNGPQGALAFDLEGLDSHATNGIPPAPSVTSAQTAAEEVEHYWCALLRDVQFTDYPNNSLVAQAVADMNNLSYVRGSHNQEFPYPVTPQNLFQHPGDRAEEESHGHVDEENIRPGVVVAEPPTEHRPDDGRKERGHGPQAHRLHGLLLGEDAQEQSL